MIGLTLLLCLPIIATAQEPVCELTACQALEESLIQLTEFADKIEEQNRTNDYLVKLERRLRSLEQPGNLKYTLHNTNY